MTAHELLTELRSKGVEIKASSEDRLVIDVQIQRKGSASGHLYHSPVDHGQGSWKTQTNRTRVGVRLVAEPGRAPAKDFRLGLELGVNLQPYYWFVLVSHSPHDADIAAEV